MYNQLTFEDFVAAVDRLITSECYPDLPDGATIVLSRTPDGAARWTLGTKHISCNEIVSGHVGVGMGDHAMHIERIPLAVSRDEAGVRQAAGRSQYLRPEFYRGKAPSPRFDL